MKSPEKKSILSIFSDLRADYVLGKETMFRPTPKGISASGSNADYHYRMENHFFRMMEIARDLDRNNCVIAQGVNRVVTNILSGAGMVLNVDTGDEELNSDLETRFNSWAEDKLAVDIARKSTFSEMARLALRHTLVDGDCFILPLREGKLQAIEAHRVRTPRNTQRNVIHGVLLNDYAAAEEYWIAKEEIDQQRSVERVKDCTRIRALDTNGNEQVFHCADPVRFSQTRGITCLAPVADIVGMHDDLQFANLVKAQVAACIAFIRNRDASFTRGGIGATGSASSLPLNDALSMLVEEMAPGMELRGLPGEKIEGFAPTVPSPEFFKQAMLILTIVSVNLGIPVAVLLLDPSETNFSGWRGAIDQARISFRRIQGWLASRFHRNVYLWKLRQWVREDATLLRFANKSGITLDKHAWNPPSWAYINPLEDAQADTLRISAVLSSRRRIFAERGLEWNVVAREAVADNGLLIELAAQRAQELNQSFPNLDTPITWRDVLALPTPSEIKMALRPATSTTQKGTNDADSSGL